MNDTVQDVVARGVKYMDTYGPADWRDRIDLEILDIESCTDCVLGQVFDNGDVIFGGYGAHIRDFEKNVGFYSSVWEYGFSWGDLDPQEITAEWKRVLSA